MNQKIIAAFVSRAGTTWQIMFVQDVAEKRERVASKEGGRKIGNGLDSISWMKTSKYAAQSEKKAPMKRVPVPETRDADGFATSLSTNRHDSPLPPAVSNYYKVIRTSWGGRMGRLARGRGTYQYLWWWWPDLQEHGHIRGVSQLRKWPLSEIKVTFWWQKWSVGQYRFPQTVPPIYVARNWGKLVHFDPILNAET